MKLCQCTRGASAVEFALLAPLLLLILFATIEYGRLFWTQHVLHDTAITAARCMAVPQIECAQDGLVDQAKVVAFARQSARALGVLLAPGNITLDPSSQCQGVEGFSVVKIMILFDSPLANIVTSLTGGPLISAQSCYPNYAN